MRWILGLLCVVGCRAERPVDTAKDTADTGDSAETADSVDTEGPAPTNLGDLSLRLTSTGGCADLVAYAVSADLSYALYVRVDGLIAVNPDGTLASYAYTLPDPAAEVYLEVGDRVGSNVCNDAPEGTVEDVLTATAGDLSLSVDEADPEDVRADVFASDIELYSETTNTIATVDSISILDASVGWLPG